MTWDDLNNFVYGEYEATGGGANEADVYGYDVKIESPDGATVFGVEIDHDSQTVILRLAPEPEAEPTMMDCEMLTDDLPGMWDRSDFIGGATDVDVITSADLIGGEPLSIAEAFIAQHGMEAARAALRGET